MRNVCCVLAALLFWGISVSKVKAEDPENYFIIKKTGEKIMISGDISMDAQTLYYAEQSGKRHSIAQKKVKMMLANNRLFLNLPITAHMFRLQEVIAYNKDYTLTVYYQGFQYAYVWDKKYTPVLRKMTIAGKQKKLEKQITELEQFIQCPEVYNKMRSNLQENKPACEGISGYSCDDSDMPQGTSDGDE